MVFFEDDDIEKYFEDIGSIEGVNPSTGAKIQIAKSTIAKFKVGAKLKRSSKKLSREYLLIL